MTSKTRFEEILRYFKTHQPNAETELHYQNAYQLLVAVVLSAQCTDKRVNMVTPKFFEQFPNAESLAKANFDEVFNLIRSISYPNNKAKHLIGMAQTLTRDFKGIVPDNIADLQKLPGVGRKTANVVASVIYNKPTMAVDTHVFRVSARLGLTNNAKTPLEAEKQLVKYIPENLIPIAHHWLILHGRYICTARKPMCEKCPISKFCKHHETTTKQAKKIFTQKP